MKYDKNGFPVREWYKKQLEIPFIEQIKSEKNQKYYTGGSIVLMFLVIVCMYLILQ